MNQKHYRNLLILSLSIGAIVGAVWVFTWVYRKIAPIQTEKKAPWHEEDDDFPTYVPPCDTSLTQEEFSFRKKILLEWKSGWEEDERDSLDMELELNPGAEGQCGTGLEYRRIVTGSGNGNIHERESYVHNKQLLEYADMYWHFEGEPLKIDTVCESLRIDFLYCEKAVVYDLFYGLSNKEYPFGTSKLLTRSEADSVLHSWGIKRELPPEDHPWLYREAQLQVLEGREKGK